VEDSVRPASGRSAADILRDARRKRTRWYEIDSPTRRAVQMRLPQEGELYDLRGSRSAVDVRDMLAGCVIDWRNFTEADILGADQGSDSPMPFSRELFEEWVFDHVDVLMRLATNVIEDARKRNVRQEDEAKNSETS